MNSRFPENFRQNTSYMKGLKIFEMFECCTTIIQVCFVFYAWMYCFTPKLVQFGNDMTYDILTAKMVRNGLNSLPVYVIHLKTLSSNKYMNIYMPYE